MAYPRSVSDYLNLGKNENPTRLPDPVVRHGTMQILLTENATDECGPIEIDVQYLAHYRRVGFSIQLVAVFSRRTESCNWKRLKTPPTRWTKERLVHAISRRVRAFTSPTRLEQVL